MDLITMFYYAVVCAALSVGVGPQRWSRRLIVGAIVGLVAAAALPMVRNILGL